MPDTPELRDRCGRCGWPLCEGEGDDGSTCADCLEFEQSTSFTQVERGF